jgi:hypothetical protein
MKEVLKKHDKCLNYPVLLTFLLVGNNSFKVYPVEDFCPGTCAQRM